MLEGGIFWPGDTCDVLAASSICLQLRVPVCIFIGSSGIGCVGSNVGGGFLISLERTKSLTAFDAASMRRPRWMAEAFTAFPLVTIVVE